MQINKCNCGIEPIVTTEVEKKSKKVLRCWLWCPNCLSESPKTRTHRGAVKAWNESLNRRIEDGTN